MGQSFKVGLWIAIELKLELSTVYLYFRIFFLLLTSDRFGQGGPLLKEVKFTSVSPLRERGKFNARENTLLNILLAFKKLCNMFWENLTFNFPSFLFLLQ